MWFLLLEMVMDHETLQQLIDSHAQNKKKTKQNNNPPPKKPHKNQKTNKQTKARWHGIQQLRACFFFFFPSKNPL